MNERLPACEVLLSGAAEGNLLRLDRPLSFWGGVDPITGDITDPRHPQCGVNLSGRILAMERSIGSSSSSSILLELMARKRAPAGLILTEPDAILTLGVIVAREMGYGSIPVFILNAEQFGNIPSPLRMTEDGQLVLARG